MDRDREVVPCGANESRAADAGWAERGYADWAKPYERYVMAQFKFSKPADIEAERQEAIR